MAITQLSRGERHTFASSPLRVEITGSVPGVTILALDQSGTDVVGAPTSRDKRVRASDVLLVPTPRRLRLTVLPSAGGVFPADTQVGLTVYTQGGRAQQEQVLVTAVDVSALVQCELAVLEFAAGRTVLSVSQGPVRSDPVVAPAPTVPTTPAPASVGAPTGAVSAQPTAAALPPTRPLPPESEQDPQWLREGRYALRLAHPGTPPPAPASRRWAVVLTGSISMLRLQATGSVASLVDLVCGIEASRTGAYAESCLLSGAQVLDVPTAVTQPSALSAALDADQPWSSTLLAPALSRAADQVGPGGGVLVVTDGVPGDVDELVALASRLPDRRFTVLATGVSEHGLPSDRDDFVWWREELGGFATAADVPNVRVVAVRVDDAGTVALDATRAGEIAERLARPVEVVA